MFPSTLKAGGTVEECDNNFINNGIPPCSVIKSILFDPSEI